MIRILVISFFLFLISTVNSINIEGVVRDAQTGELLIGANVFVKNYKTIGTTSGLDGSFVLKIVQAEKVVLVCSYISYQTLEIEVKVPTNGIQKLALNLVSFENELNDVIVTASSKTSDVGVRAMERLSSNVINIVGARSIEISPDLTVANVLGRVSGVTLERNSSGEAEYAVLRGMDKRYNITLVNGVKISSPNNKQRYVPLNIFPSDLLDRLEVSKSRNAEIEGDATGGAVNLVMKDAPSRLTVRANIASGYNAFFFDQKFSTYDNNKEVKMAPYEQFGNTYSATMSDFGNAMNAPKQIKALPNLVAGFSIGNHILKNKLGYIVAANFQHNSKGANSTFFEDEMVQTESTLRVTTVKERLYSENQTQYGIHAKLNYQFSKNHKVEWYNFLVSNNNSQVRQSTSTNFKLFYEPEIGNLDLAYQTRLRTTNQYIFASLLQGENTLNNKLFLNWSAVYSKAGFERPDQTYINLDNLRQNYIDNINIDGDGSDRRWEHNSDQMMTFLANGKYEIALESAKIKLQAGGLFRNVNKDNFYVNYKLKPVDTNQSFETIDQIKWTVYTPKGSVGPLTYSASEITGAGYLQGRYERTNLELIAGVRAEYINQSYHMFYPNAGEPADGGQQYVDILPNIQLKYSPRENTNWRASYYRSVNRPGYYEIVPYQIKDEEYTEYGNKDLNRNLIDNVDVRWEFFPKAMDQILVGAFYKNINSPIEYAYFSVNQRQSGYGFQNLGNAQNFGLELDVIKYIRFLGVKANYTYTHSAITTSKVYYGKDEFGNTKTLTKDQTRPLVGQAEHVANVSLMLKDVNNGWDGQLSASYTGDKIVIASRFLDSDYWEKGAVQMDASIEKSFKNKMSIFAKANNLLNTPSIIYLKTHNVNNEKFPDQEKSGTIIRKDHYKQSFLIGVRLKL
ncbi:MAG: TonB-dependent receptor domain-containing protein [Paludibacter sp.]